MHKNWQDFLTRYPSAETTSQAKTMLCDISEYGLLKVSGSDAKKLLQGQLTCDVEKVSPTESSMGAHCNPKGRIISLFYLFQFQDAYYLLMPRNMMPITLAALKKYAVFYKTVLNDASDDLVILGYDGELENNRMAQIKIADYVTRRMMVGEVADAQAIWEKHAKHSRIITVQTWKSLMIHDGIPTIHPETSGTFLPHEINLDKLNAINFEKGCYTGQEIIARMHYRGKLKTHMYLAQITRPTPLLPGSNIYTLDGQDTKACGTVVDACHEEYNNYSALILTEESNIKNNHIFLVREDQTFFRFPNE